MVPLMRFMCLLASPVITRSFICFGSVIGLSYHPIVSLIYHIGIEKDTFYQLICFFDAEIGEVLKFLLIADSVYSHNLVSTCLSKSNELVTADPRVIENHWLVFPVAER